MPGIIIEDKDVIAQRRYTLGPAGELAFTVRIGRPVEVDLHDCRCHFQFIGGLEGSSGWAAGNDSIDALNNVLLMLGTKLEFFNQTVFNHRLVWRAAEAGRPLGLPVPVIDGENVDFRKG